MITCGNLCRKIKLTLCINSPARNMLGFTIPTDELRTAEKLIIIVRWVVLFYTKEKIKRSAGEKQWQKGHGDEQSEM